MLLGTFYFVFGAIVGSFLNAVIYRLPRDINIAFPRSSCPGCKKLIPWYENVPVLSYLFLRGRCSGCRTRISARYPAIEFLSGAVSYALAPATPETGPLLQYLFLFSVFCIFVCHFFIDLEFQILPDPLNIGLAALFLAHSLFNRDWGHWALGAFVGAAFPYGVMWIFYKLKGVVGLGMGDVKLYGALGLYLGPFHVMQTIFLSCLLGSIIGGGLVLAKKMGRDTPMPFGPAIIVVAAFQIFFTPWYLGLLEFIGIAPGH